MKLSSKSLALLFVLWTSAGSCFSLDREAFTITNYDLDVRVEPEQQRLAVRGKITLRNDSEVVQKVAVLQISSSLDWRAIRAGDEALQFVTQPYASDMDHTGALSEAIVTLPSPVAPKSTRELDIAYEGVIPLDATRLTRIGTPEDAAASSDWDQISPKFTAVRGAGNVAWYPIATESANLSEADSLFEVLHKWKTREAESKMHLHIGLSRDGSEPRPELLVNNTSCFVLYEVMGGVQHVSSDCIYQPLRLDAPAFVVADYQVLQRPDIDVHYLRGHDGSAAAFAEAALNASALVRDWFGTLHEKATIADLADSDAAPFESGSLLLMPLGNTGQKLMGLVAVHQFTHAAFSSPRPWINEGLAHFAQVLYLEQSKGRQAAVDYMGLHRAAFSEAEKPSTASRSEDEANRSLVNTGSEELYRSKAMCVWWMLREMIGDSALKKALVSYRPERDKEPSYMPRLIQAQTQRDLEWFFDDWVYRDRGLPDFKVESALPRKTLNNGYMSTITVVNLGTAGGEVPIIVKFSGGEVTRRLVVHGKDKAVIRIETPAIPEEVVVNDGSVPESDTANNTFKVEAGDTAK
jgi:hypothetical protein